jgi:hypothetical protein
MTCEITFKDHSVELNNRQFANLIDFAIAIGERSAASGGPYVDRMKKMRDEFFWPGRGIAIEEDFPDISERKFWSCVFFDASRAIFDRTVGVHEHSFWQARAIHQAHSAGLLFELAVRDTEREWSADTIDRREFDRVVNGIER